MAYVENSKINGLFILVKVEESEIKVAQRVFLWLKPSRRSTLISSEVACNIACVQF